MLLGIKISTVHLSLQDDVLVQSLHGWLVEEGDESGFGMFILHPSVCGLSFKFPSKFLGQSTSLGITMEAHLEVEG